MMSASSTSDFKGTVRWMAPELLIFVDGEPSAHSEMTDIWALGMVAYVRSAYHRSVNFQ